MMHRAFVFYYFLCFEKNAVKASFHISAYTQPTHVFSTVKGTDNIFHSTKNQVRGLCVGGDIVILFFTDPAVFTQTFKFY